MDQNACSVCGFTTADFAEFTRHVEKHERDTNDNHGNVYNNGRDAGNKSKAASAGKKLREELRRLRHSQQRRQQTATTTAAIMDLQQPNSEEQQEAAESANHSATMLGHLADLSRFLTAATCPDGNGTSEEPVDEEEADEDEDQAMVTHSASPLSPTDQSAPEDSFDQTMEEEEEDDPQQQQKRSSHSGGKKGKGGGKTTHRCPHCTFTTYMSQHMKSHLRAHDNFVGQMYICDVCGMAFSQKANMHRHRGTHSGVKPYECRFCQKKFFRKDQMQEHSMTHIKTGDDFDCPVSGCECKFSQHSMLRQHLDQKHAISSSKQAHCKRCTLQFSNSRRLLLHYQTKHDEYYSSISPVPEGQSPVKRLLNGQQPQNDSSNPPSVGASPPKTRRSRKRPRPSTAAGVLAKPSKKPNISTSPMVAAPSNGVGGYKVEELLRLDCGGTNNRSSCPSASASVSPAITVEDPQLQQQHHNSAALFAMSSPSQSSSASPVTAAGLDHIFRDHLLFRHSLAAAQQAGGGGEMGNVLFPLPGSKAQPKSQQQQEAAAAAIASAAAAQLFMQSVWMATNSSSSGATKTSTPTMAPSICGSNIRQHRAAEITSNEEDEPKHRHLPLAKSPDCRGLMLNGFKTSTVTARAAGKQPKRESKTESQASTANTGREEAAGGDAFDDGMEEAKQRKGTTTSPSTAGTCSTRCQQQHHEASVEQKRQQRLPDNSTMIPALGAKVKMEASETTQLLSAAAAAPSSAHQQPTTATAAASAHSSTTHSPSSSSTASSSCVDGSGSGSATSSTLGLDNSPLKVLNGKLLTSSGLLSRALTASEGLLKEALNQSGEMDCTHCGLLFTDQTLYLLHKGLHSEADPWRCNLCGQNCSDKYTFTTHMISSDHS